MWKWLCAECCSKRGISKENKQPSYTSDCEICGADEGAYLCFVVPSKVVQ